MHILLSRTDRIGDLVLSTPAIATVRRSFPGARITAACSPYNRVVLERNTDVDDIVELRDGASPATLGAQFRGSSRIAIALSPRLADLRIVGATRAAERVGYTYTRRVFARAAMRLFVNRVMISEADPELAERRPGMAIRHEVEQLLDLVSLAGATERVNELRLDVRDEDRAAIAYLPRDPIVLHLGQRWFSQGSTLESTIALMRMLRDLGRPFVVTYAPECENVVHEIAETRVADVLLGGLPFYRWAAVFERAAVVVTVDTGATHVASALRRPTVVIFEHKYFRLNSQEWSPYRVPSAAVRKPPDEAPESLARFRDEIASSVKNLLS